MRRITDETNFSESYEVKQQKYYRICSIISFVCFVIFLVSALVLPVVI